jgi:acetate kinase
MKVLVINAGSSSLKYQLFDMPRPEPLASGLVERIGQETGQVHHTLIDRDGTRRLIERSLALPDHRAGLAQVAELLLTQPDGIIDRPADIAAIGHRVVHGGERFSRTTHLTPEVKAVVRSLSPLAPLHNPPNLQGIEVAEEIFPQAQQVAVFDTAFHQTMPPYAYRYAIPNWLYDQHSVRAYGFHGTSHLYVSKAAAAYLGQPLETTNLITAHLGNGCSITAVQQGKSIDTSMGFSPLPGLMMGTRSGDLDPAVITFLNTTLGMSLPEIDTLLNKQSGLLGISGRIDVRDIQARQANGDAQAQLALEMYTYRLKKYIGAYTAALGRVDALIFTAGVGENSATVRRQACAGLAHLGLVLDEAKNQQPATGAIREIQADGSRVKILVIPTNEELEIARQTFELVSAGGPDWFNLED